MSKGASHKKTSVDWEAIVSFEGEKMGIQDLRLFRSGKQINDAFYAGTLNGVDVLLKCSSIAPDSIVNEYEMLKRCYEVDSSTCPKPFGVWQSQDKSLAFVVQELLPGPDFKTRIENCDNADSLVADVMKIANALEKAGIVHRDVSIYNMTSGADGHLRIFDFQFAIDSENPVKDPYLAKHPKYHYCVFGVEDGCALGEWEDARAFVAVLKALPQTKLRDDSINILDEMQGRNKASLFPNKREMAMLSLYRLSLRIQSAFARGGKALAIKRRLKRLSNKSVI